MTITPKRLISGVALTTSYVNLYAVSGVTSAVIKSLLVCNDTSSSQTVSVQIRPQNGIDLVDYNILSSSVLQPYETKVFGLTEVMPNGYSIWAKASNASAVSITASGMENI